MQIRAIGLQIRAIGTKEDPDDIKENNGKNGYITTKDMNNRFKKAESKMQAILKAAFQRRVEYIKNQSQNAKK